MQDTVLLTWSVTARSVPIVSPKAIVDDAVDDERETAKFKSDRGKLLSIKCCIK